MSKDLTLVRKRLCARTRRATGFARACKASVCSKWQATVAFSATCVHLHFRRAVVFGIKQRGGRFVPERRDAWSNLQAVDGRSHIGSGLAWRRTTDSHPSRQIPTLQFKICPPLSE